LTKTNRSQSEIPKRDPKTIHVYLSHGSPIKSVRDYYTCTPDTDFALCLSDFWKPIESYERAIPEERFVVKGSPRNDALFSDCVSMAELFGKEYKKVVVWYPTFRQHKNHNEKQVVHVESLPVLHDAEAVRRVNEIAAKYGVLIVLKPHPAQDLALIHELELDHLKFIDDSFYREHGISAYEFLGQTDALITDYSSVLFDYLLTGKPVALTWEDFEEYKKKIGFAIDMELLRPCAEMLDTPEDFERFLGDLAAGNDPHREQREELTRLTNRYVDGEATKRVVDWLESLLAGR
jgi:Putative glycosyl/glycerophosphate transferases involved in teichoic acid biosynthesis TagF/TagB/EpsJ/RodC